MPGRGGCWRSTSDTTPLPYSPQGGLGGWMPWLPLHNGCPAGKQPRSPSDLSALSPCTRREGRQKSDFTPRGHHTATTHPRKKRLDMQSCGHADSVPLRAWVLRWLPSKDLGSLASEFEVHGTARPQRRTLTQLPCLTN